MSEICQKDITELKSELKELFNAQIDQIRTLINANDKAYNQRFDNIIQGMKDGLEAANKGNATALASADKATLKAESATEKRFESVNEFRQTLSDQASKFIVRTEFELVVDRLEQDIKNLVITRADMVTNKVYDTAHKDLQKQVDDLRLTGAALAGKASQESVNQLSSRAQWAIIFSLIGTTLAVIGFILKFI